MKSKNVVIIGDSYSTFEGYIPEGYAPYYTPTMDDNEEREEKFGIRSASDTWWWQLKEELSLNLVENNSWSGSTVSYSGRAGDCSATSSFIFRAKQLIENGLFEKNDVDTVLVFGATNDSWIDVPLGEDKLEGITHEDLFAIRPAIAYIIDLLRKNLPNAEIVYILNTDLKPEINEMVKKSCAHFGARLIELKEITKCYGHPNHKGMTEIKEQVKAALLSY